MLIYGKPLDGVASFQAATCRYLKDGHLIEALNRK